jgi:hypothetical protein
MAKTKPEAQANAPTPPGTQTNGNSDPFKDIPMIQGTGDLAHLSVGIGYLTPEICDQLPEHSPFQRKESVKTGRKYARLQREGKWINEYPGGFYTDKDGNVMDGGHRKMAVKESRVAIPIILCKGLNHVAAHAIDRPRPRTLAGNLAWDGKIAAPILAQQLRFVRSYREDGTFSCFSGFDVPDYYETMEQESGLIDLAPKWDLHPSLPKVPAGLFGAVEYLIQQETGVDAHDFLKDCARGEAVVEGDPAFAFREWVLSLLPKRTAGITAKIGYSMIFCWKKAKDGAQITKLRAPSACPPLERELV